MCSVRRLPLACLRLDCRRGFIGLHDLLFLLFRDPIIEGHAFEVLDIDLVAHFLFPLLLLAALIILGLGFYRLSLGDLPLGLLAEDIVVLL